LGAEHFASFVIRLRTARFYAIDRDNERGHNSIYLHYREMVSLLSGVAEKDNSA
jgi:hypothetical protein